MPGKLINRRGRTVVNFDNNSGGSGGAATLIDDYVQPAVNGTVTIHVSTTDGNMIDGFITVAPLGGKYTVTAIPNGTHLTIENIGDPNNAAVGSTVVAAGAVVSFQAPDFLTSSAQQSLDIFTPEQFGAVGDGTTNDNVALVNFEAARSAAGGIGYLRKKYGTSAPVILGDGVVWMGIGSKPDQSSIIALGSMAAPVVVQGSGTGVPNKLTNITFDAARLADCAFLEQGNGQALMTSCHYINGVRTGERTANATGPAVIVPGAQIGPGPAITFSQIDPAFLEVGGPNVVAEVAVGGALGTAAIRVSFDGGATFAPTQQVIFAQSQLGYPGGVGYTTSTGVLMTCEAGVYVIGTRYPVTVTGFGPVNNAITHMKCFAANCGTVYATAALAGGYPGPTFNTTVVAGTVTTNTGDQMIVGSGTSFLSMNLMDGDMIRIPGLTVTKPDGTTAPQRLMVSVVLDDTHIVVDGSAPPNQSVVAADYAISSGAGFWEDVQTGDQNDKNLIQPQVMSCAMSFRIGGLSGSNVLNPFYTNWAISAFSIGTAFAD